MPRVSAFLKVFLAAVGGILLIVALILVAAWLWVISPWGERFLAAERRFAVSDELVVTVAGARMDNLGSWELAELRLTDADGPILTARDLALGWVPAALLARRLEIDTLAAETVTWHRMPELAAPAREAPSTDGEAPAFTLPTGDSFALPELPADIIVRNAEIARLAIRQPVVGEAMAWRLQANLRAQRDLVQTTAALDLRRQDGPGRASLSASLAPRRGFAHVSADWQEDTTGGLLARLLNVPEAGPAAIHVTGRGWLDEAELAVTAELGDALTLATSADLARQDTTTLAVTGEATGSYYGLVQANLPAPGAETMLAPLLDGEHQASLHGELDLAGQRIRLDEVTASGPAGSVTASGALALADLDVTGELRAELGAPAAYRGIIPGARWDAATITAEAAGTLPAPRITAEAEIAQPGWHGWRAEHVTATGTWRLTEPAGSGTPLPAMAISARLNARAPRSPGPALANVLGDEATIAAEGIRVSARDEHIEIAGLTAETGAYRVTASGAYGWASRSGTLAGRLTLGDLTGLQPLAPAPLTPAGRASASFTATSDGTDLAAQVTTDLSTVRSGLPGLDSFLAAGPRAEARLTASPEAVTLDSLRLSHPDVSARANGRLALSTGAAPPRVTAEASVESASLAALRDRLAPALTAAGLTNIPDLAGRARLAADLTGPLTDPELSADLEIRGAAIAGQDLGVVTAGVTAGNLADRPAGTVTADLLYRGRGVSAAADWALAPAAPRLTLQDIALAGPGTQLSGAVTIAAGGSGDPPALSGEADLTVRDLSALAFAVPELADLTGSGRAQLRLTRGDAGAPSLSLTASARDVAYQAAADEAATRIADIQMNADLTQPLTAPSGTIRVTGEALQAGDLRLDSVRAEGDLAPQSLAVTARTAGELGRAVAARTQFTVRPGEAPAWLALDLASLTAQYGDEAFELAQPANITFGAGHVTVPEIRMAGERGEATLSVLARQDQLAATANLQQVPLALIRLAVPGTPVAGRVDAELTVAGTPAEPRAELEARLRNVSFEAPALVGLPNVEARVTAEVADGQLSGTGIAVLRGAGTVRLQGRTGFALDPATLAPELSADQPVRARTDGQLRLAAFNDFLAERGIQLNGRVATDLALVGTLGEPALDGALTIENAAYEMPTQGVQVRGIEGQVVGAGERLELADVTGETPNGGQVSLAGWATLIGEDAPRTELTARLREANLVALDTLNAVTDADIVLSFAPDGGRIEGNVTVNRANYRIPSELPQDVVAIEVTERWPGPQSLTGAPRNGAGAADGTARNPQPPLPQPRDPAARQEPTDYPLTLDIRVFAERRLFIRGRGLDLEMRADLHVFGPADDLTVEGDMRLVRGTMDLLGRRFTFDEGTISFPADRGDDPELDLVASTNLRETRAQVAVTGRLSAPEIAFTSDPPLAEEEILSRILFGRPVGDLSPLEAVTLANQTAALTGGGLGIIEGLRQRLNVDRLTLRGGGTEGEAGEQPAQVGVGSYVGDRVFVDVTQGLNEEADTRVSVEFYLTPNVTLESRVDQAGQSRVGINVSWDY